MLSKAIAATRSSLQGNVGFGAFSRAFSLGSQFIVLILLGKLLPKAEFGNFMIIFALTRILSQGMGTGLATLLVYHISRNASAEREHGLFRSVALLGLVINGVLAAAMMLFAATIASWFGKPDLAFWITGLAPFTLISTLLAISVGTFEGRGRITASILVTEFFPNLIRLILLPTLLLLHFGNMAVVIVMTASVALPMIVVARALFSHAEAGFARLTSWDLHYSWKLTLHSFAAMQAQGVDMLVVGWLFSSTVAADYAIASRVAALIPFFQQIIVKTFMTRSGRAIHDKDDAALQAEIERSRSACVVLVTLTAVAALIAYPLLLAWMSNFGGSLGLMAAMVVSPLVRAYFPGADALLRIAGLATASLTIMLISCSFVILFPVVLHPWTGIYAMPLGMFASAIILNPISAHYIRRRLHVQLATPTIWVPIAIGLTGAVICLISRGNLASWFVGVLVVLISLIPTLLSTPVLRKRFARA
ncbi:oligosaccharide flippase family protein [Novosphingobium sp. SG707]|uniref:lipopolysaccharide biosynthesis protein n=1 Tax=Novosphingobium sp. SG707 TaxID=2586996 RepID=UPI001445F701|nr:oligosaccharide flippase family protein [Novosphingobium sp. SG707]NKJ02905.1 O-antigen/teichoic acid export membrane protein [Novosphingobium sp. SG707]